jgi:hypothetical protein
MAIEIRNRLSTATGLRLHATVLFDFPTVDALSDSLNAQLPRNKTTAVAPANEELDRLEALIGSMGSDDRRRSNCVRRLTALLRTLADGEVSDTSATVAKKLQCATDDELIEFYRQVHTSGVLP